MPTICIAPSTVLLTEILPFMHKILSPFAPSSSFRDSAVMARFGGSKNSASNSSINLNTSNNYNNNNNNNNNSNNFNNRSSSSNNNYNNNNNNNNYSNNNNFYRNNFNTNNNSNNILNKSNIQNNFNNSQSNNFNNIQSNNNLNKDSQYASLTNLPPPTTQADYESFLSGPSYNMLTSLCTYSSANPGNYWDRASKLETWFIPDDEGGLQEGNPDKEKLDDDIEEF